MGSMDFGHRGPGWVAAHGTCRILEQLWLSFRTSGGRYLPPSVTG